MRKLVLIVVVLSLFVIVRTKAQRIDLTGTWKATTKEVSLTEITFGAKDSLSMVMDSETFGGKDFKYNGKSATLTYKVDFSVKPAHLKLIIQDIGETKETIVEGLIMIIKPDVVKIAFNFSNGKRPTNFTISNSSFFKKI